MKRGIVRKKSFFFGRGKELDLVKDGLVGDFL